MRPGAPGYVTWRWHTMLSHNGALTRYFFTARLPLQASRAPGSPQCIKTLPLARTTFARSPVQLVAARRNLSLFPKLVGRLVRVPVYLGGGVAAAGSYIAYKIDDAKSYTKDKLGQLWDLADDARTRWQNRGPNEAGHEAAAARAALAGAAAQEISSPVDDDDDDDDDDQDTDTTQDQMLNLTKQMIEIRTILNKIDSTAAQLSLPSIVVIGSQSSGKSSVLESIVGREFLPKGSNMVTRRPIELTLVNTPNSNEITADFPTLRIYGVKDFQEVRRVLTEQNLSVPSSEAVSEIPIELTIKSSTVPDLSLVDLPGYIQVEAADQPLELKSKIKQLCEKYLMEPNIILAISAADVDLANSSALRAAKVADPKGLRTIGVITKLDLVEPEIANKILNNKKYPLTLGYVGVITKAPAMGTKNLFGSDPSTASSSSTLGGIFNKNHNSSQQIGKVQLDSRNFEREFFRSNKRAFNNCEVSTKRLREKLIKILEVSMSNALEPTSSLIQLELDDTAYSFKVEFNDRQLTPKSYLLNNIDVLKLGIKDFQEKFRRNELKSILKADLDQKILDIMATRYWKDDSFLKLNESIAKYNKNVKQGNKDDLETLYWHKKLDLATSSLTKLGIGRLSTMLVTSAILKELDNILQSTQLKNHDLIKELVTDTAMNVLNSKYYSTADQVENCIKPFKYEIDLEDRDWELAQQQSIKLLKEELRQCNERFQAIKTHVGAKKLNHVVDYLRHSSSNQSETLGISKILMERGSEALFLEQRTNMLNKRLKMVKNKCRFKSDKDCCPEVFLNAVSEKLTSTAVLFLNVELLSDFFYNFPIELDKKLGQLTEQQIEIFAKEDPRISRHIELQKRKELLELALHKIDSILVFKRSYKGSTPSR